MNNAHSNKSKLKISLKERILSISVLVQRIAELKEQQKVFVDKDDGIRVNRKIILGEKPEMHSPARELIAELIDFLPSYVAPRNAEIISNRDLEVLISMATTFSDTDRMISSQLARRSDWGGVSDEHCRHILRQKLAQRGRTMRPLTRGMHGRTRNFQNA